MASYNLNLRGGVGVFALLAVSAVATLEARTVAWYHFDEVVPGTRLVASDRALNAVDSSKFQGEPHSLLGSTLGTKADFMPISTNDVPDTVEVLDPVSGTSIRNERSLFFFHADNEAGTKPARRGGCIKIASDSSLSLTNLTVEFFVKPKYLSETTGAGFQLCAKESFDTARFTYSICLTAGGLPYVNIYNSAEAASNNIDPKTGSAKFVGRTAFLDGNWHHLAFTAETSVSEAGGGTSTTNVTLKLYSDGKLESTVVLDRALEYRDSQPLYLMASQMGYYMSGGFIDEVRISDEALVPEQFLRYVDTVPTRFHADFEGNLRASTPAIIPDLAGTAGKKNNKEGANPTFSTEELPGRYIVDGLGNTLRETNACSLRFVGSTVTYPPNPDLEMPEMTVEFFMKYQAASNYAAILRFNQATNNWGTTPIWNIGFDSPISQLIMRIDTTRESNQSRGFGNSFLNGKWHHVGVTFQQGDDNITVRLYDNYRQVGTDWSINGRLDYSKGSCLGLGTTSMPTAAFTGWLDEVRISRGVLPVEEFMRAEGKRQIMIIFR